MNRTIFVVGGAVALLGSALAFFPFFLDAYGLPKLALGAIGALILALGLGAEGVRPASLWRPIAALAAACAISWALSADPAVAWVGVYSQPFHALALFAQAVVVFAAFRSTSSSLTALPVLAALGLIANGVFCALQLWRPSVYFGEPVSGRAIGTIGNPAFLGAWAAACLPLALAAARGEGRLLRLLGALAVPAGAFVILASRSRGALLAALAGLWAFSWALGSLRARRWHLGAVLALLAALAAAGSALGRARSDPFRLATWGAAARAWAARPVVGWGPEAFPIANRAMKSDAHVRSIANENAIQASAHNDLLQAAATLGLLGLLAYLWLWLELAGTAARAVSLFAMPPIAGAVGALAALFVQAKLNPIPPPAILTAAAAAGLLAAADSDNWKESRAGLLAWLAACALAIASIWPIGRAVLAESLFVASNTFFARGRLIEGAECIRAAQELRPHEAIYAQHRVNRIIELSKWASPRKRQRLAALAVKIGGRLAQLRPNDPGSWELLAVGQLLAAKEFGSRALANAAVRSSRRAIEIDPLFIYSRSNLVEAERALGRASAVAEELRAIERIENLKRK